MREGKEMANNDSKMPAGFRVGNAEVR